MAGDFFSASWYRVEQLKPRSFLWTNVRRKTGNQQTIDSACKDQHAQSLVFVRYLAIAGIAELPGKNREVSGLGEGSVQRGIDGFADTGKFIEIMCFFLNVRSCAAR